MEQKSMVVLEKSQLDFFGREISAMAEELMKKCRKELAEETQELRSKNWFLEGDAKKLRIRVKQLHRVVNEKSRMSNSVEKKLLECLDELEKKNNVVKELEGQVKDLRHEFSALALTVVAGHEHHKWGKRFMKQLKRCAGGHSGTVEPDEEGIFHSRRSCSSV